MAPLIFAPSGGGSLLQVLLGTAGESSGWTAAGNHPLALAGLLLAVYWVLGMLRRRLGEYARGQLRAESRDR